MEALKFNSHILKVTVKTSNLGAGGSTRGLDTLKSSISTELSLSELFWQFWKHTNQKARVVSEWKKT
jgi:hypothetical protein